MSQKIKTSVEVDGYLSADHLKVSTSSTETVDVGEIVWNAIDGTFDMGLIGGVALQAGQELHMYGKATEVISNGQAVMFAGVQGDHILIAKADAATINANPEYLIGVATQDFANNQFGYVTVFGNVRGLDTTAYTLGTVLYYDSTTTTDGLLTDTMPVAPNAKIEVAAVVKVHATQGILLVRPHAMPKVKDLQDVYAPSPSNKDVIFWNSGTSRYENNSIAGVLGYTPANSATTISTTSPLQGGGDLSANRTFSITQATASTNGYLSSTDWNTFNSKIGGSGTTNYVPKFTGSGTLGNSALIEQSNILRNLSTVSVYPTTGNGYEIFNSSSSQSIFQTYNRDASTWNDLFIRGNNLVFWGNGSERMRITSIGNVNIGGNYTSTTNKLQVTGNAAIGYTTAAPTNGLIVSGNVGIGTDLPNEKLEVNGNILSNDGSFGGKVSLGSSSGPYISGNALTGQLGFSSSAGSPSMVIDIAGRVGIGTVIPQATLDVNGANSIFRGQIAFTGTDGLINGISLNYVDGSSANSVLNIRDNANGLNRVTFLQSGNVGIGTTSPLSMLHAKASGYPTLTLEGGYNSGAGIRFFGNIQYAEIFGEYESSNNGLLIFRTRSAGSVSERMRITSGGNVGIGTIAPGTKLEVNSGTSTGPTLRLATTGISVASNTLIGEVDFYNSNATTPGARSASYIQSFSAGTAGGGDLRFGVSANAATVSDAMRINSNGRVGIGSSGGSSLLQLTNDGTFPQLILQSTTGVGWRFSESLGTLTVDPVSGATRTIKLTNSGSGSLTTIVEEGNVLIGTTTDNGNKLQVDGSSYFNGNVGIGTISPQTLTHLYTSTGQNIPALGSAGGHLTIQTGGVIATVMGVNVNGNFYIQPQRINGGGSNVYNTLLNPSGGNVGIGTSSSTVSKLQINSGWGNVPITSNRMLQMDLGDVSDYQQHVILLHPIYDTTLINYNFCIGSIYSARGTTSAGRISDNYNVDTASAYNSTSGTVNSTGQFGKLYTCMYNGVKYIALMPFYRTSATGYTFDGYSSSTGEQLKIVVYRTSNTGVVNNSEVYNSLVEYASGPSLYQGDIQTAKSLYASGNIAIGTGTSTTKLTIDNSASSNTNHIDMVGYSSTAKGHVGTFSNALYLSSNYYYAGGQNADTTSLGQAAIILQAAATTGSYIDFNTGSAGETFPTNRMRITSGGKVNINNPTVDASEPLRVKGEGAVSKYGIFVQLNSSAAIGYPMRFWNEASNSAVGSITMNSASTSYNTSSDYRLKEDIKPVENALERLQNLKPVNFAWKVDGSRVDGFIAHELADVIPSAVSGEKDATEEFELTPAVLDEEGNIIEEAVFETRDVYQGIDQSKIVPLLVAAIQEQQEIIKQLENRIINLENK